MTTARIQEETAMEGLTIGRAVWYRTDGRNGLVYDLPAVVTVTYAAHPGDYPDGATNPLPKPHDDEHVHLTVFTPGGFGSQPRDAVSFVGAAAFTPGSGTYVEHNVPYAGAHHDGAPLRHPDVPPRTWRWPARA